MKKQFVLFVYVFFSLSFDRLNIFKYCIIASLIHELGHIAVYLLTLKKLPEIEVSLFGMKMKNNILLNKNYIFILMRGPSVNLIAAVCCRLCINKTFSLDLYIFSVINAVLFIINSLPVYYLDGGQILYSKSRLYQRYYREISVLSVISISVMLLYFTDINLAVIIFIMYFIINIANDV